MLSKCANPECPEIFKYLHQGKIFRLSPIPEVGPVEVTIGSLHERFWLCDRCSRKMKVVWDGTAATLAPLAAEPKRVDALPLIPVPEQPSRRRWPRARAASAGRDDR